MLPGLRFRKLDLHLHTPASRCFKDKTVTPEAIVEEAMRKGLSGIAVTDHNSGEWIDRVKTAARGKLLAIFPGVEVSCTGAKSGVHLIALFDVDKGTEHVHAFLNTLGLKPDDYGNLDAIAQHVPQEVIRRIHEYGGVASLAHANSTKGVLGDMAGEQRTKVVQCPYLFAAEATDFQDERKREKATRVVDLLDGTDATFKRKLAVYQASDNPCDDGSGAHGLEGIGTRCSYFKMERVNLDGLRQCFFDPDVRIRQDFEFQELTYPYIKSITIRGGFLDEATATFHPGLNSILGAKGTGKSLLVELLRFALDQESTNQEISEDHESKLEHRFGQHSVVEVVVVDETGKELTMRRTYLPFDGNPYENEQQAFAAQGFPVLFLSQNEIIRIAESEDEQIAFIDRFFDFRSYRAQLQRLEGELKTNDRRVAESIRARETAAGLEKQAAHLKAEIDKLNKDLRNPAFEKYAAAESKRNAFTAQHEYVTGILESIDGVEDSLVESSAPELPEDVAGDPALKRCHDTAAKVPDLIRAKLDELRTAVRAEEKRIKAEIDTWQPSFESAQKTYRDTVKTAGGNYKDLDAKRTKAVGELGVVQKQLAATAETRGALKALIEERNKKLAEIERVYEEYSQARRARCAAIQSEADGRLQVSIHTSSNVGTFREQLLALRKGSGIRESVLERLTTKIVPKTFIFAVFRYQLQKNAESLEKIAKQADVDPARLKALADFLLENVQYEELLELQYKAIPQDRPEILYNLGNGKYEPLSRVSIGQKAVTLLIMTLSEGTMPIAIDQPEDSLDLRSVWDDICTKIRRGKERRQFVFTTHNASLAVASDTDCFTVVVGDASHGSVLYSGSMDHRPMEDEVLTYLEGGPETYATKFRKYNADRKLSRD